MSESSDGLEAWWQDLGSQEQQQLLDLDPSETLPPQFVDSLAQRGVAVIGSKWEHESGFAFYQPEELMGFLDEKRREQ
ncbi:hypothetical protein [Streptomyces sp. NPDC006784]|uniref:hypothetical protein n=1 Tax=Streptomyces sp. NPDC006784 TaxID=3364764 RepID=UPI00367D39B4